MATKVKEELTQSPEQIRDEALMKMGDDAERLLKDDSFINIINSLAESTYAQFVNSKLEDKELRDQIYAQYRGLTDIMGTLNQRVSVRNQILERDSNEEE
jgi:ethanolamine ammonia-lyase large subunit